MKKSIFAGALLVLLFYACKEDQPDFAQFPNFGNLAVGNYWIYQQFELDTNGMYTPLSIFDSTFVEKDTVIGGKTYFKYVDKHFGVQPGSESTFVRDSLHYLVNASGRVLFSSENFVDTFVQRYEVFENGSHSNPDTLCFVFSKMTDDNLTAAVPAGAFVTKNAQEVYLMYPGFDKAGKVRAINKRYAEEVGLVEETLPFYISSPLYRVRRLLRYGNN